jgi:hypothetical protein
MLLISSTVLTWLRPNPLPLLMSWVSISPLKGSYFQILPFFGLLLVLCNIWPLLALISNSVSIPFTNICMLRLKITFAHSNAYCVMLKERSIMAFNFIPPLPVTCLFILMLTGLVVLIHVDLPPAILLSWATILSPGAPRNNPLFLAPVPKLNIDP